MAAEPEPAPGGAPLPPELRPVTPPANRLPLLAFRVAALLLPLAAATLYCLAATFTKLKGGVQLENPDSLWSVAAFAALAAIGSWLTPGSAKRTWRIYRGLEPPGDTGPLQIVAAALGLVGLFFAFAVYSFGSMFRYRTEKQTQYRLSGVRSALSIYYGDLEGAYPAQLQALTVAGKYLSEIPKADIPKHHWSSTKVRSGAQADDAGGWMYNDVPGDANRGSFWVNCTHTDTRGSVWTTY